MRIAIAMLLVLASLLPVQARNHGGIANGSLPASCPEGTALPDGCPAAPANGQFLVSNFFSTAPSTGQTAYSSRPGWNVAGVDYGIGNYTATASLPMSSTLSGVTSCSPGLDSVPNSVQCSPLVQNITGSVSLNGTVLTISAVNTNLGSLQAGLALGFSCNGCNHPLLTTNIDSTHWNISTTPTQNGSNVAYSGANIEIGWPISIKHYNFADAHFYAPCSGAGDCSNTPIEMEDIAFHVGVTLCQSYGGNGMIQANALDVTMKSVHIYYDPGCSPYADLFKSSVDPGLTTLSTGTGASIVSGLLHMGTTSDTWYVGQYIYYGASQVDTLKIVSFSNAAQNCTGSGCNSLTATLGSCPFGCGAIPSLNVGATTIIGGPIETTIEGAISGAFDRNYQYVASEVGGNLDTGAANGNIKALYSYVSMSPEAGAHSDGISQQPVGDVHDWNINYSMFRFSQQSYEDVGTAVTAIFSSNGVANKPGGYQVTRTNVTEDHDTIIASLTYNATTTASVQSGTYNNSTGDVALTVTSAAGLSVGNAVLIFNLAGTGAVGSLDGTFPITSISGTTVHYNPGSGLGASTITGCNSSIGCLAGNTIAKSTQAQTANGGRSINVIGQGDSTSATYTGSMAGTTLHVSAVSSGTIAVGDYVICGAFPGCQTTKITAQQSTAGGDVSTWTLDYSQTVSSMAMTDQLYLGQISGTYAITNNKFDCVGSLGSVGTGNDSTYYPPSAVVTNSGNTNLQSGAAANSSCPTN